MTLKHLVVDTSFYKKCNFINLSEHRDQINKIIETEMSKLCSDIKIEHKINVFGSCIHDDIIGQKDIDLLISVDEAHINTATEALSGTLSQKRKSTWTSDFRCFNKIVGEWKIDYVLTTNDSYTENWYLNHTKLLLTNGSLRKKYNDMKLRFQSKDYLEYKKEKYSFWEKYGNNL